MKRYELDGIIKNMIAEAYYKGAVEGTGLDKEDPDFGDIVNDAWKDVEEDIFQDYEDEIRETLDDIIRDEINEDADEIDRMVAEDDDPDPEEKKHIRDFAEQDLSNMTKQEQAAFHSFQGYIKQMMEVSFKEGAKGEPDFENWWNKMDYAPKTSEVLAFGAILDYLTKEA